MDALVSRASMIWLSLHPLPASEASAFNKIRAFISRCARPRPFRVIAVSCSRSSPLNRTTYFFTIICFAVMIASVARVATKANHQILSTSLKLATSWAVKRHANEGPSPPLLEWIDAGEYWRDLLNGRGGVVQLFLWTA